MKIIIEMATGVGLSEATNLSYELQTEVLEQKKYKSIIKNVKIEDL
jgi:hypothetical protein